MASQDELKGLFKRLRGERKQRLSEMDKGDEDIKAGLSKFGSLGSKDSAKKPGLKESIDTAAGSKSIAKKLRERRQIGAPIDKLRRGLV